MLTTIRFRELDHQGTVPSFIGRTAKDPNFSHLIIRDVKVIPAEKVWPTPEEVAAARKGASATGEAPRAGAPREPRRRRMGSRDPAGSPDASLERPEG